MNRITLENTGVGPLQIIIAGSVYTILKGDKLDITMPDVPQSIEIEINALQSFD